MPYFNLKIVSSPLLILDTPFAGVQVPQVVEELPPCISPGNNTFELREPDSILKTDTHYFVRLAPDTRNRKGSYGEVFAYASYTIEGEEQDRVAVKRSGKHNPNSEDAKPQDLFQEALRLVLGQCIDGIVPKLYGIGKIEVRSEPHYYIIMEWVNKSLFNYFGNLLEMDALANVTTKPERIPWARELFFTLLIGLSKLYPIYKHSSLPNTAVPFGDLKIDHVMIRKNGTPMLIDFMPGKGSLGYIAPERIIVPEPTDTRLRINPMAISKESDIFALGVLMIEVITGVDNRVFIEETRGTIKAPSVFELISDPTLREALRSMLDTDPTNRPDIETLLADGDLFPSDRDHSDEARLKAWGQFKKSYR